MLYDYHVHTRYSDDSEYQMEQVVSDAIGLGLNEICITDHVDYGIKIDVEEKLRSKYPNAIFNVDYAAYFEELKQLRGKYAGQISLKQGMEFGVQTHTIPQFEELFSRFAFDFIIFSCHQVEDKEFWTQDFQKGRTQKEYNERYYAEILEVVKRYKNYSVLGHLDLIRRYDPAGLYPFEKVSEVIAEILKIVIADGKGIEVNTSSLRYGLQEWMPSWNILKLYKDLGGEILTIGSDCHAPEHLGAHIPKAMEELKREGFRYICTYEQMKPIFHKL